jgi:hypothetical protein
MPAKAQAHFLSVWPRDHYMPLQRFTLGSMTCLAKVLLRGPSCTMWFTGIAVPIAAPPSKAHSLKQSELVSKLFHTRHLWHRLFWGVTPKNWSLANSSKNHPQTMKVATFPTVSWPCSNTDIYQLWVHSHRTGWKTTNHHSLTCNNRLMTQQQVYDYGANQDYTTQNQILNLRLHEIMWQVNIL